jgi:Tfp pilus assembly protein PilF
MADMGYMLELDPEHYRSYFKRAAVYLSLGKSSSAARDFTKVIELHPEFEQVSCNCVSTFEVRDSFVAL